MSRGPSNYIQLPSDFKRRLGYFNGLIHGIATSNVDIDTSNVVKTIWPIEGIITKAEIEQDLFVSSTDSGDVGQIISVTGLNQKRGIVDGLGVLAGQDQSVILNTSFSASEKMLRVNRAILVGAVSEFIAGDHNGTIYIAEADSLSSGVPDTLSKIRLVIPAKANTSTSGYFTVPSGFVCQIEHGFIIPASNKPIDISIELTSYVGNVPVTYRLPIARQITALFSLPRYLDHGLLTEGTDVEFRISSQDVNACAFFYFTYSFIPKDSQSLYPDSLFGLFD